MALEHWRYFLALERDFVEAAAFVEPCADNYPTYSTEFTKLILGTCSEIDAVAKVLCTKVRPSAEPKNIDHYRSILTEAYPKLDDVEILVPRYALSFHPWSDWGNRNSPKWWTEHTEVKHHRHESFKLANLGNCLLAGAGLFALVLYLYQPELYAGELNATFDFFGLANGPKFLVNDESYRLPDFP